MRIIINADDLGASRAVNAAIFALMAEGLVTSSTILANGPAEAGGCAEAGRLNPGSFGVHLNLTEFKPLTTGSTLRPLLNDAGEFNNTVRSVPGLSQLRPAIFEELCAQVERVRSRGIRISHLDSHHHVHTIPALLPVVKAVQRRFGIRKVRISRNVYVPSDRPSRLFLLKKRLFNAVLRRWYATRVTDMFTDLQAFIANRAWLSSGERSIEIMLHPGADGAAEETSQLRRLAEQDAEFRRSLISYHEL